MQKKTQIPEKSGLTYETLEVSVLPLGTGDVITTSGQDDEGGNKWTGEWDSEI